jgi:hypothetical protein
MTSPLERRLRVVEGLLKPRPPRPDDPVDPRVWVMLTLAAFHGLDHPEDEHPLDTAIRHMQAAKEAGAPEVSPIQEALDRLFDEHGIRLDAGPTEANVVAMQRLLDGVPERWRDAHLASVWWPATAAEMWDTGPDGGGQAVAA